MSSLDSGPIGGAEFPPVPPPPAQRPPQVPGSDFRNEGLRRLRQGMGPGIGDVMKSTFLYTAASFAALGPVLAPTLTGIVIGSAAGKLAGTAAAALAVPVGFALYRAGENMLTKALDLMRDENGQLRD